MLPYLRAHSRNVAATGTGVTGLQFVEGSFLWDSEYDRLRFGNGRSVGRGGLAGEVFLDLNANGRRDAEEQPVGGVRLQVGAGNLRTDSAGRFSLWDLVPFERTSLEIDTLSFANPLWLAAVPRVSVAAAPNAYQYVPVPVIPGGEISGVVRFPEGAGAGGLTVRLRHRETGTVKSVTTFSDGAFYALGLRPGRYRISLDPEQLARLGLRSSPVEETLRTVPGGAILEGVVLEVRR